MPSRHELPQFAPGQRSISARSLNALSELARQLDRSQPLVAPRPVQHIVVAQEEISADAKGSVKYAFWDDDASGFEARGDAFDAVNIGPDDIPNGGRAVLAMGERQIPFFQYTAAAGGGGHNLLSATHSDTVANTPSAGALVVGNSVNKWIELVSPGLKTEGLHEASSGTLEWRYGIGFAAYTSSDQSISDGNDDRVALNSEDHDVDGLWDTTNYEADISGLVQTHLELRFTTIGGEDDYITVKLLTEVDGGADTVIESWPFLGGSYFPMNFHRLVGAAEIDGALYWSIDNQSGSTIEVEAHGSMSVIA